MSKVLIFSRTFPANHPRKGQPTYFVEKFWNSLRDNDLPLPKNIDFPESFMWSILPLSNFGPKHHTIRSGNRFKVGDKFSARVWSGKPYRSKQIIIAPDIEVKKVWNITIRKDFKDNGELIRVHIHIEDFYFRYMVKNGEIMFSDHDCKLKTDPLIYTNDGLSLNDFVNWFKISKKNVFDNAFKGQIICWSDNVNYKSTVKE